MNKSIPINHRRWISLLVVSSMFLAAMVFTPVSIAKAACGSPYYVQNGDSLSSIALACGISLSVLEQANPQINDLNLIYPGEQVNIPSGIIPVTGGLTVPVVQTVYGIYTVRPGDTLRLIARSYDITLNELVQINPQINDPGSIYPGEQIYLPAGIIPVSGEPTVPVVQPASGIYVVQPGDTMSGIAQSYSITLSALEQANLQITDPNLIYSGEQIYLPAGIIPVTGGTGGLVNPTTSGTYIAQPGDTLSSIAQNYGITLGALELANPQITLPSLIYPGELIYFPAGIIPVTGGTVPSTAGVYIVQSGDTLSGIAQSNGITLGILAQANPQITNLNLIYPGQQINIP